MTKEALKNVITGAGVRLVVGGDFLRTVDPLNSNQQQLQQEVIQLVHGKKQVDPKLIKAVSLYSTTERREFWKDVNFEDAFSKWKTDFASWLCEGAREEDEGPTSGVNKSASSPTLLPLDENNSRQGVSHSHLEVKNVENKNIGRTNTSPFQIRRQILSGFGINPEKFEESEADRYQQIDQQIDNFYAIYGGETKVDKITNIFLQVAQNRDGKVEILQLRDALDVMKPFLGMFGEKAGEVIRQQILARGFLHADEKEQEVFIEAASAAIDTGLDEQRLLLSDVQSTYQALFSEELPFSQQASIKSERNGDDNEQSQEIPSTSISKPIVQPTGNADIQANDGNLQSIQQNELEAKTPQQPKVNSAEKAIPKPDNPSFSDTETLDNNLNKEKCHPLVADAGGNSEKDRDHGENQDDLFLDKEKGAFGVFDGVGETKYPHDAAVKASKYIRNGLGRMSDDLSLEKACEYVCNLVTRTSDEIYRITYSRAKDKIEKQEEMLGREVTPMELTKTFNSVNMATTGSIIQLWEGEVDSKHQRKAIIANVGDSRVYRLRDGKLSCLTLDDTQLSNIVGTEEAKRIQDITSNFETRQQYKNETTVIEASTEEQLSILNSRDWHDSNWKKRPPFSLGEQRVVTLSDLDYDALTQTLGMIGSLTLNILVEDVEPGDRIILTSDGIHDTLTSREIEKIINEHPDSAQKAADELLGEITRIRYDHQYRQQHRLKADDITAIVVTIK